MKCNFCEKEVMTRQMIQHIKKEHPSHFDVILDLTEKTENELCLQYLVKGLIRY